MATSLNDFDYSQLSTADRLALVQQILNSVLAEAGTQMFSAEQIAELDRRCAAVDAGLMPTFSWEEVKKSLRAEDGYV